MPWFIGIDEAGYGPNLGPFVMTSVACRLADGAAGADLWGLLTAAVRRPDEADDGRLLIEDSKLVYTPKDGLGRLEQGVLGSGVVAGLAESFALRHVLDRLTPAGLAELGHEPWFTGTTLLPHAAPAEALAAAAALFRTTCAAAGVAWGLARSVIVCPTRFNRLLEQWDTKGAVLGQALAELLQANLAADDDGEPLILNIDKHGGRNTYAAMLQDAIPDGFVFAQEESALRSSYCIQGLGRAVSITFQPRADADHFCVALASMVSKYLREVLMHEFNGFWQQQVPGLPPTAGYPADAKRFWEAIRPVVTRLGLAEDAVWRRK